MSDEGPQWHLVCDTCSRVIHWHNLACECRHERGDRRHCMPDGVRPRRIVNRILQTILDGSGWKGDEE